MYYLQNEMPTVMVVDDFPENNLLLQAIIEPWGYRVVTFQDGESALGYISTDPPDVILLDVMMPGIDGLEVCRRLKRNPRTRHIPVIIITAVHDKKMNIQALEAGADDFLVKPFDSVLLGARIRSSYQTKLLQDQILEYQHRLEENNELLEKRIQERTTQVSRTQQIAVFSLAKLSESRDTETGAHLERIRSYAREIALEVSTQGKYRSRVPRNFAEQLYLTSPLHDIGKVGIPDRILLKPGKLSPEEFDIMKRHTVIGGDTLGAANMEAGMESFLSMGRDIAYYHHERWDGQGYPQGFAEEQIPLAARIVAVSDVYDALTSRRPYKEAFSHETSMSIVLRGRGTSFDPDVIDAFVACEEKILAIRAGFDDIIEFSPLHRLSQMLDGLEKKTGPWSVSVAE